MKRPLFVFLTAVVFLPTLAEAAPSGLTGGGCLTSYEGTVRFQSFFGGTVPGAWEHHFTRDHQRLVDIASTDADVVSCRPDPGSGCGAPPQSSRIEFAGTCDVTFADQPTFTGNFSVTAIDVGPCGEIRDSYAITVRRGASVGQGEVVYEASGLLDCGNLRVEAPWLHSR